MTTHYATVTLGTVGSTQDEARQRLSGAVSPVLVVAERQEAGRGRSGRVWDQAPRALYSSLAVCPDWPVDTWPRLALVTGLAVRDSILESVGVRSGLKWPNDIVTAGGKLGGILIEAERDVVVIGCGLNLWWPPPDTASSSESSPTGTSPTEARPPGAVALCSDDPGPGLAAEIAAGWATRLLASLASGPDAWPHNEYRQACVTLGQEIEWQPSGRGRAVDIDPAGGLVVETPSGRTTLFAGEVRSVRPSSM